MAYALEDSENTRLQLLKIVGRLTIHRPDKLVSGRVEVNDELEFAFVAAHEVTVGLCLSFGERSGTSECLVTRIFVS